LAQIRSARGFAQPEHDLRRQVSKCALALDDDMPQACWLMQTLIVRFHEFVVSRLPLVADCGIAANWRFDPLLSVAKGRYRRLDGAFIGPGARLYRKRSPVVNRGRRVLTLMPSSPRCPVISSSPSPPGNTGLRDVAVLQVLQQSITVELLNDLLTHNLLAPLVRSRRNHCKHVRR
jgi:hypothetical protein